MINLQKKIKKIYPKNSQKKSKNIQKKSKNISQKKSKIYIQKKIKNLYPKKNQKFQLQKLFKKNHKS